MSELISFYDWLAKHRQLRTPVGEFARTVSRDKDFPRDVATLEVLLDYVRKLPKTSAQAVVMARTAYQAYVKSYKPAPSL